MMETTTYKLSADRAPSTTVVECVADVKGVDPSALDDRLYDRVDPGALDSLFGAAAADTADLQLSFQFADCRVTLDGTGTVAVAEPAAEPAAPTLP